MAIAAKRYSFLNNETSVPSTSFTSGLDSGVLNSAANETKVASDSAVSSIKTAVQTTGSLVKETSNEVSSTLRSVKSFSGNLLDLSSLSDKRLDGFIEELSGADPAVSRSLSEIMKKCVSKGSGYGIPGKPSDASIFCGSGKLSVKTGAAGAGGNSKCDAGTLTNMLNKLSGGSYNNSYKDTSKTMQQLMSLSGMGYNLGLCGVFGAISGKLGGSLGKPELSKALGGLMGVMASGSKTNAVLDLAKSAVALAPLSYVPGIAGKFLSNYKNPDNVGETKILETSERVFGGLELMDGKWNKSNFDGMLSVGATPGYRKDLSSIMTASCRNNIPSLDDLDRIPVGDKFFTASAMSARF